MSAPEIYTGDVENIQDVIMTGGIGDPYTYWSAYSLTVPNLKPADVVLLIGQYEVTNPWPFAVQVDEVITRGPGSYGATSVSNVNRVSGQNVDPSTHHRRDSVLAVDTGQSGSVEYNLTLEAASTGKTDTQNYLVLEKNGELKALVFRAGP